MSNMEELSYEARIIKTAKALSVGISPLGGDPINQVYDEESGSYLPDRTLLPLTLVPEVTDGGEDFSGNITSQGWYMVKADGTEQQITSSTAGHSLVSTSRPIRLQVKTNNPNGTAAKYIYRCTAGKSKGMAEIVLRTGIAARQEPTLEIDAPASEAWNPFRPASEDVRTISYKIQAHGHTGLSVRILKVEDGTPRAVDPTDPKDLELELTADGIKVDRRWMGQSVSLIFELVKGGNVADRKYYTATRRIPEARSRMRGSPVFSEDDTSVRRSVEIELAPGGIVDDPSQEYMIKWFEGSANVGTGNSHTFPCKGKEEMKIKATIEDRGPLCLATVNGAYLMVNGVFLGIR